MNLLSNSFTYKNSIPSKHTCQGLNSSPQLSWTDIPVGTKSIALIVDDPDAPDPKEPKRTFVHWVLYNIPSDVADFPEGVNTAMYAQGLNDTGKIGYTGPCPPIGEHRYFFKLYALDYVLPDLNTPTKSKLLEAMEGHVLEMCELVGVYEKN